MKNRSPEFYSLYSIAYQALLPACRWDYCSPGIILILSLCLMHVS